MPEISGLLLLRQIKQSHPDVVVIMQTAVGEIATAVSALNDGASGYLVKPMLRDEVLFHVRSALERRQLVLERRTYVQRLEQQVREQTHTIRQAHEETIHRLLSVLSYRDYETGAHIRRTGLFSEVLAKAAGWDDVRADQLRMAAPMHDLGKIGIADSILRKPGKLTAQEFEIMKTHAIVGAHILEGSESAVLQLAQQVALSHHEWWNGRGYPHGLAGEAIPESAMIVAIADVYDALSHDRIYRPAFSEPEIISMMLDASGTHFNPRLLECFLAVLPEIRAISAAHPDSDSARGFDPTFWTFGASEDALPRPIPGTLQDQAAAAQAKPAAG
jgi:putative two-component system response regulator